MRVVHAANVCTAWYQGATLLNYFGEPEESRAGRVLVVPTPVTTVYQRPCQRVLFCPSRDANPWFHLFESMWMLAGDSDARFLDTYVRDFSARFAEVTGYMHGAYGYRWRRNFLHSGPTGWHHDQLQTIANMIQTDPSTRRAVLTMWDPHRDLNRSFRDHPCNTHAYFRVRREHLDMTVLCRSNDIVWGAYGANAVHMSVVQEWMAAATGLRVGTLTQVSNNFHAYEGVFQRIMGRGIQPHDLYARDEVAASPLFTGETMLVLSQLREWVRDPCGFQCLGYNSQLFEGLLLPMARAHQHWRDGRTENAVAELERVQPTDWRRAAHEWMQRRLVVRAMRSVGAEEELRHEWTDGPGEPSAPLPSGEPAGA